MASSTDGMERGISRLEEGIRQLREALMPESDRTGLDFIRGPEDRALMIRFGTEVYHGGPEEQVAERERAFAKKDPVGYARIKKICGTVPAEGSRDRTPSK